MHGYSSPVWKYNLSSFLGVSSREPSGPSRRTVNVADAYDPAELQKHHPKLSFDPSWDKKNNFRTREVLSVPINFEKYLLGVVQLVNRTAGGPFTPEEVAGLEEVAKTIGIAFYNKRQQVAQAKPSKYGQLIAKGTVSEQDVTGAASEAPPARQAIRVFRGVRPRPTLRFRR